MLCSCGRRSTREEGVEGGAGDDHPAEHGGADEGEGARCGPLSQKVPHNHASSEKALAWSEEGRSGDGEGWRRRQRSGGPVTGGGCEGRPFRTQKHGGSSVKVFVASGELGERSSGAKVVGRRRASGDLQEGVSVAKFV